MEVLHKLENIIKEKDDVDEVNCWQSRSIKNNCAVIFWLKKILKRWKIKTPKILNHTAFFWWKKFSQQLLDKRILSLFTTEIKCMKLNQKLATITF